MWYVLPNTLRYMAKPTGPPALEFVRGKCYALNSLFNTCTTAKPPGGAQQLITRYCAGRRRTRAAQLRRVVHHHDIGTSRLTVEVVSVIEHVECAAIGPSIWRHAHGDKDMIAESLCFKATGDHAETIISQLRNNA